MKTRSLIPVFVGVLSGLIAWLLIENRNLRAQLEAQAVQAAAKPHTIKSGAVSGATLPSVGRVRSVSEEAPDADTRQALIKQARADMETRAAEHFNRAYLQEEVKNARFFQHLKGWSPDRVEAFKRMLAEQDMRLMGQALSGSGAEFNAVRTRNEAELKSALSDNEYALFQETQRMESSRETVSNLVNAMRSRGNSLDSLQEEAVLQAYANALYETASQAPPVVVSQLSPEQIAAYKRTQMQALNRTILHHMSGLLDETQVKSFMEAYLEQEGGG